MKRFGSRNRPNEAEIPVGEPCGLCGRPMEESDQGFLLPSVGIPGKDDVAYHAVCLAKAMIPWRARLVVTR